MAGVPAGRGAGGTVKPVLQQRECFVDFVPGELRIDERNDGAVSWRFTASAPHAIPIFSISMKWRS